MTLKKKWPEEANWAREDSISKTWKIENRVFSIIDREQDPELIKELAKVAKDVSQMRHWLIVCKSEPTSESRS
jgi:hypothetical protein